MRRETFKLWDLVRLILETLRYCKFLGEDIYCEYVTQRIASWHGTRIIILIMTSSNGNIFRVTGPLCGEFTGHLWIPLTTASDSELWCFFLICAWINGWVNNLEAGDLRRNLAHYEVIVMFFSHKNNIYLSVTSSTGVCPIDVANTHRNNSTRNQGSRLHSTGHLPNWAMPSAASTSDMIQLQFL